MRLKPDAHDLLATALDLFRAEILPAVPPEKRYAALMIASALSSAQREFAASAPSLPAAALALYQDVVPLTAERFAECLAADIETGRFDAPGPRRDAAFEAVKAINAARLAITNPKRLRGG
jgi:hypothetical protein